MFVSSLEYCANVTIGRFLTDDKETTKEGDTKRVICYQIKNEAKIHILLDAILTQLVENRAEMVTDELIVLLLSGNIHMKHLVLEGCINVTIDGFSTAIDSQPFIESVNISSCKNLAVSSLGDILAQKLPHLESLSLESCNDLTDEIVKSIMTKCSHLSTLNISSNQMLTDQLFDFSEIDTKKVKICPLSRIDLSGCQGVSSTSIRHMLSLFGPTLQSINISWTKIDCTALVYLSGYSLSSAVYLATISQHKMPFSVAELEASQEFEFQVTKKQSIGNINYVFDASPTCALASEDSKNNVPNLSESILTENERKEDGDDIGIIFLDGINGTCESNMFLKQQITMNGLEMDNKHLDQPLFGSEQDGTEQMHNEFSSISLKRRYRENRSIYCSMCSNVERLGLKRIHSYNCINESDLSSYPKGGMLIEADSTRFSSSLCNLHSTSSKQTEESYYDSLPKQKECFVSMKSPVVDSAFQQGKMSPDFLKTQFFPCFEQIMKRVIDTNDYKGTSFLCSNEHQEPVDAIIRKRDKISSDADGSLDDCDNRLGQHYEDKARTIFSMLDEKQEKTFLSETKQHDNENLVSIKPEESEDETLVENTDEHQSRESNSETLLYESNFDSKDSIQAERGKDDQFHLEKSDNGTDEGGEILVEKHENRSGLGTLNISDISSLLSSQAEFYKPRQMFVSQITDLDISQIQFYDADVGMKCLKLFVTKNHQLQSLSISWQGLTDNLLDIIAQNEPNLVKLSLAECECLSNSGIFSLGQHCKKIQDLDLQGVPFINDRGLKEVISNGLLSELSLAECAVTDLTLQNIAKFCFASITCLNLSWCENITDKGLISLLQTCSSLESLNLRQCEISAQAIEALTFFDGSISYLGLCSIQDLTDNLAKPLVQTLIQLTFIDLSWNCLLTDATLSVLMTSCIMLREGIFAGLKRITSKSFLPIISGLSEWRIRREFIRNRLRKKADVVARDIGSLEILDPAFYLPYRSLHYAPNLCKIDLSFSDKVNDTHLAEIVSVCRGTLAIDDYYSMPIKPRWNIKPSSI